MAQLDVTDQGPSSKVRPRPRRSHQSIQANVNQDNDTEMKTSQNSATDAIIRNGKRLNPAIVCFIYIHLFANINVLRNILFVCMYLTVFSRM